MKCLNPRHFGAIVYPCGSCPLCEDIKRKKNACRALLGYTSVGGLGSFVTLTYSDDFLPSEGVKKRAITKYHHKLRKIVGPLPPWLACGEYGDENERAHYHLCYFGKEIDIEDIECCWPRGIVDVGPLHTGGAVYITKDLVKGRRRPEGMNKPFVRFSNHFPDGFTEQEKVKFFSTGKIDINGRSYPVPDFLKRRYHDLYKSFEVDRLWRERNRKVDKLKKNKFNYDSLETPKEILSARARVLCSPRKKRLM